MVSIVARTLTASEMTQVNAKKAGLSEQAATMGVETSSPRPGAMNPVLAPEQKAEIREMVRAMQEQVQEQEQRQEFSPKNSVKGKGKRKRIAEDDLDIEIQNEELDGQGDLEGAGGFEAANLSDGANSENSFAVQAEQKANMHESVYQEVASTLGDSHGSLDVGRIAESAADATVSAAPIPTAGSKASLAVPAGAVASVGSMIKEAQQKEQAAQANQAEVEDDSPTPFNTRPRMSPSPF